MPRFKSPGHNCRVALLLLAPLAASWPGPGAAGSSTDASLLLEVVVNGHPINRIGDFRKHDGGLYATVKELKALGLRVDSYDMKTSMPDELALAVLPGVTYRLDEHTQTVYLTVGRAALEPTLLVPQSADGAASLPVESGLGAAANYTLVGTLQDGRRLAEGLLDARVFSPVGVVSSSLLGTQGSYYSAVPVLRLDTTYVYSDPGTLRRYRLGDVISGSLDWSRPVRLGGVQITSDFSIRPDLVTFPVPTLSGEVAVPSSVEVLVNGVQYLSRDVPPGPFEIRQLPIVTGSGDISVVVRNAIGQETTETLPVYASGLLLTPGLSAFSAELGAIRLNYGLRSNDYRAPAGSFTYRYGLLQWLTLQTHGEASGPGNSPYGLRTRAAGMAGGGPAFTVRRLGVISLQAAGSRLGGRSGSLASLSYERVTPLLSLSGSIQLASGGFGDIASASGDPVPRRQMRASIGLPLGGLGSLGIAYVGLRRQAPSIQRTSVYDGQSRDAQYRFDLSPLVPAAKVALVSASYSRQILGQRAYFYATGFHDFSSGSGSGFMAGITIPLGRRSFIGGNVGGGSDVTLQASQAAGTVGDVGWQVQEAAGGTARQSASTSYRSPWGLMQAGLDRVGGQTAWRGSVQGAVAFADGGLFASNTISDSFAVVDTGSFRNIGVLQENRPIGHTNASGLLFVPDLRSFGANRLAIDPDDVPVDADIGQTTRMVRPQDRSGVVVRFTVRPSHGALVRLVDDAGAPVAVGSTARLAGQAEAAEGVVGYDGEAFVTGLEAHDRLMVMQASGRRCVAAFDYRPNAGKLPEIGPVTCREVPG